MLTISGRYSSSELDLRGSIDYWLSDRVDSGQVPRQVLGRDGRILVTEWQDEKALLFQLADKVFPYISISNPFSSFIIVSLFLGAPNFDTCNSGERISNWSNQRAGPLYQYSTFHYW